MKNGFNDTVDRVLRRYGLLTRDCVGTILSNRDATWRALRHKGYRIEKGVNNPDYDYIILSKEFSTVSNILEALTKIKVGCIIIFNGNVIGTGKLTSLAKATGTVLSFYSYGKESEKKFLGVLFKGKEI
jgi:hypothetical protein